MLDFSVKLLQSETVQLFLDAADKLEPRTAQAVRKALEGIRNRASTDRLARLIAAGDVDGVEALLRSSFTDEEWQAFRLAIRDAVRQGEVATAQAQPTIPGVNGAFSIVVGDVNPRLSQFAETMTATRVREIDEGTRQMARELIRDGSVAGDDPFAIARRVRETIGLTARQNEAVQNYETALRSRPSEALRRELRDRRSDASIIRQIDRGAELSEDQIQSLVRRYRARMRKYRSEMVARTEIIRAVQGAQWELFEQMIERGQIDRRQVRRTWIHTRDERTRAHHRMIASMNPRGVGQNEAFQSPDGPIMYPGDPDATAANTVNCRCAVFVRVVSREIIGL